MTLLNIHFPFEKQIISFLLWIDSAGYKVFNIFYKTFIKLAQQELFASDSFEKIYNNFYGIIGIIALFLISYMLLKMMINPSETKSGKEIKDIIVRFVISMMLIVLLPTMFTFLKDFQNSLLQNMVVPKVLLNSQLAIQKVDENGNYIGDAEMIDKDDINLTTEVLQYHSNEMISSLIQGMMYPLKKNSDSYDGEAAEKRYDPVDQVYKFYEENDKEWTTNVSEWWDGSSQAITGGIGCALGLAAGTIVLLIPGGQGIGAATVGGALGVCIAGLSVSELTVGTIAAISAKEYTWTNALQSIVINGNYSQITLFAQSIVDGRFHYTPILSTIVVGILVYMIISFCIDIVVRQAKLLFYQLLAPLCFMISVIPSKKGLMSNWFKLVITTWLEVFIRVACVCAIVLLVGMLDLNKITDLTHPIISAFIILGIVIFAKQIPKLFKDVTGLDSGSMKIGLKDKIATGGGFVAGSIVGAGAKMFGRGLNNTYRAAKNNFEYDKNSNKYKLKSGKNAGNVIGSIAGGLGRTATGTLRAQISGGINSKNAKSFKDMQNAANKGVSSTEQAQDRYNKYVASHGDTIKGVSSGLGKDAIQGFKNYIGAKDEILAKVKAEDEYVAAFDDYEAIYGDSAYKALDMQADQLEARIASESSNAYVTAGSNITLGEAFAQAKDKLLQKRLEAIEKNLNGSAYVVYSLAKMVSEDPDMAINIGASKALLNNKDDFTLKTNKLTGEVEVCHKNGNKYSSTEIMTLLEGTDLTTINNHINGYTNNGLPIQKFDPPGDEMYKSKKTVKARRNNDKNSVAYKEAIKEQQNKKNNN